MNRRISSLDGVRGMAVLLVTVSHAGFPLLKLGAITGVTLFFVLSGYLITNLLQGEIATTGGLSLRAFYLRRAARLLPALAVMLAAFLPLALLVGNPVGPSFRAALCAILYVKNLEQVIGVSTTGLGHLWSLSLEEQFYVLWPALLLLLSRFGRRAIVSTVAAGIAISLLFRVLYGWSNAHAFESAYYLPQSSVWAILGGVLLAVWLRGRPAVNPPAWLSSAALVGLLATSSLLGMTRGIVHSGLNYPERLAAGPIAAVFSILLIWSVTAGPAPRWITHRWLLFFGTISYALYLWHDTLSGLLEHEFGVSSDWGHLVIGSSAAVPAIGIATLSYRYIERPAMLWVRRRPLSQPARGGSSIPAVAD